ncbi:MAG: Mov34/MPN/PAD-1 family protein [Acidimicrobiales bacterium]
MLTLRDSVAAEMIAHALRGLPHEACGLFATHVGGDVVQDFFPMRNVAASSEIYQLDGAEMMAVERSADDAGLVIAGVMHSHTHTTAYPSPTDVADAATFDPFGGWHFVIVSLKDADPVLRDYRIVDGEITEHDVALVTLE